MSLEGHVDEITRSRVRGWVFDPERASEKIWVTIRVNNREVTRCAADRHRDDLQERIGDGNYEFCFDFEPPLSVFEEFAIEVAVVGSPEPLERGTKTLPAPQTARIPGQLVPILLTSTGRAGTTLLMHEFLRHPEILVAGRYPFEIKLINYYAAAFRALVGNEDRVHSTDPDHMFAEQNRKLIGHNPYNSPGHHGFVHARYAVARFFEKTIPERLASLFRDLVFEYYALAKSDGDKAAAVFFAEKSALDDAPRQAARRFFGEIREIVLVRDPRDLMCSAMSFWGYSGPDALKMLGETLPQLEAIHDGMTPDTFFLRYEDLIEHPAASRSALYRFIGTNLGDRDFINTDADLFRSHATSRDPSASIGRWQTDLSKDYVAACDISFASFMERFGYAPSQQARRGPSQALEILFGTAGNSDGYLCEGWSAPEAGFIWTLSCESRLQFPRPRAARHYALEMRVRPFVAPQQLSTQRLSVTVNDVTIGAVAVEAPALLRFSVPWTVLAADAVTKVTFSLPDATRPSDVEGSHDRRRLSLAFERLALLCDSAPFIA